MLAGYDAAGLEEIDAKRMLKEINRIAALSADAAIPYAFRDVDCEAIIAATNRASPRPFDCGYSLQLWAEIASEVEDGGAHVSTSRVLIFQVANAWRASSIERTTA